MENNVDALREGLKKDPSLMAPVVRNWTVESHRIEASILYPFIPAAFWRSITSAYETC